MVRAHPHHGIRSEAEHRERDQLVLDAIHRCPQDPPRTSAVKLETYQMSAKQTDRALRRLADQGRVEFRPHPDDQRQRAVYLAGGGQQ